MPIKNNGYSQVKAHARQDKKRNEANIRQAKYDSLTTEEKIALVVKRGGSNREFSRLATPPLVEPAVPPTVAATQPGERVREAKQDATKNYYRRSKKQVNEQAKIERPGKS